MKEGYLAELISTKDKVARCCHDMDAGSTTYTKIVRKSLLDNSIDGNIPSIDLLVGQWEIPHYPTRSILLLLLLNANKYSQRVTQEQKWHWTIVVTFHSLLLFWHGSKFEAHIRTNYRTMLRVLQPWSLGGRIP